MEDFKVLLVDDEEDFLESLSDRLRLRDVKPDTATNGQEALDRVKSEKPTVIVLDLKMPGMDGMEVLRRVKKAHPRVQIVILTGHGSIDSAVSCTRQGAYSYLQKPCELDDLLSVLTKAYKKQIESDVADIKNVGGRSLDQSKADRPSGLSLQD